jgi:predicted DNA-binding transcriptional regulator AlpA
MNKQSKRYLRKKAVAARYGDITTRAVEKMVEDGRLPKPIYPIGERIPLWAEDELDEFDRSTITRQPKRKSKALEETAEI